MTAANETPPTAGTMSILTDEQMKEEWNRQHEAERAELEEMQNRSEPRYVVTNIDVQSKTITFGTYEHGVILDEAKEQERLAARAMFDSWIAEDHEEYIDAYRAARAKVDELSKE